MHIENTQADVGLIIPLKEEFEYVRKLCNFGEAMQSATATYYPLETETSGLSVWVTCVGEMGNGPAISRTNEFLDLLKPRIIVCLGIGGSLSSDLLLGDVAISRSVADITDASKIVDREETYEIMTTNRAFNVWSTLTNYFTNFASRDAQANVKVIAHPRWSYAVLKMEFPSSVARMA